MDPLDKHHLVHSNATLFGGAFPQGSLEGLCQRVLLAVLSDASDLDMDRHPDLSRRLEALPENEEMFELLEPILAVAASRRGMSVDEWRRWISESCFEALTKSRALRIRSLWRVGHEEDFWNKRWGTILPRTRSFVFSELILTRLELEESVSRPNYLLTEMLSAFGVREYATGVNPSPAEALSALLMDAKTIDTIGKSIAKEVCDEVTAVMKAK